MNKIEQKLRNEAAKHFASLTWNNNFSKIGQLLIDAADEIKRLEEEIETSNW